MMEPDETKALSLMQQIRALKKDQIVRRKEKKSRRERRVGGRREGKKDERVRRTAGWKNKREVDRRGMTWSKKRRF